MGEVLHMASYISFYAFKPTFNWKMQSDREFRRHNIDPNIEYMKYCNNSECRLHMLENHRNLVWFFYAFFNLVN